MPDLIGEFVSFFGQFSVALQPNLILACAAGATDEIVLHESTGFLVPPDDTFSLRMQLQRVLDDRALLARLSVTAFERFQDHATWEQSMTSVENLLASVAS